MSWLWSHKESEKFDYGLLGADMHSHLVPGVDDGASDLATSLELIKGMSQLGFKKLITTPHIMWDMYKNTSEDLLRRYDNLKAEVERSGIDIEIRLAAEYFIDDHVKSLLANKEKLLTIKDNMVLVEFSMASEPLDLKEVLFEMQMQDYLPVIAHPERYVYHERNRSFFSELKDAGYLFQLNIMSLAGTYGKSVNELAKYFIKNDYYELAGTDLHNRQHLSNLQNNLITSGMKSLISSGKLLNREL